jgi:hypothetical protein
MILLRTDDELVKSTIFGPDYALELAKAEFHFAIKISVCDLVLRLRLPRELLDCYIPKQKKIQFTHQTSKQ